MSVHNAVKQLEQTTLNVPKGTADTRQAGQDGSCQSFKAASNMTSRIRERVEVDNDDPNRTCEMDMWPISRQAYNFL